MPFSNTVPRLAILFLTLGMLERDGIIVLLGYLMTFATCVYLGVLIWGAWEAGSLILGG